MLLFRLLFSSFLVSSASSMTLAEIREDFIPELEVFVDSSLDCGDQSLSLLLYTFNIIESSNLETLIVNLAYLSRMMLVHCDDASAGINALNRVFTHLTYPATISSIDMAISSILSALWSKKWSSSASLRACIAQIQSEMNPQDTTQLIQSTLQTSLPVPLLRLYMASGLFVDARDLAVELSEFHSTVPGCVLEISVHFLEKLDGVEPPGTLRGLEVSKRTLEALEEHLVDEKEMSKVFLGRFRWIETQMKAEFALRNRSNILEMIRRMEKLLRDGNYSETALTYLTELTNYAMEVPDRGRVSPIPYKPQKGWTRQY
jgi:hypothetical protein